MNKKKKVKLLIYIIVISLVLGGCGGFVCCKYYKHEKQQQATISELNLRLSKLNAEIITLKNQLYGFTIDWDESGYNYLAIGNSITLHGIATYWWDDDRGMAASSDEKDYVHIVTEYLKQSYNNVNTNLTNLSAWEVNGRDRAEFLALLDPYLSSKLNLVTIQLGENASNLDTWEPDFEDLIEYIREKAPNAEILIVGDFWSNGNRDLMKEQAANECSVTYVSLEGIKDNNDYYAGIGTEVKDSDGNIHLIEHEGVAKHPGDKGMEAIAERIIEALK